jgi:hypothetical protein
MPSRQQNSQYKIHNTHIYTYFFKKGSKKVILNKNENIKEQKQFHYHKYKFLYRYSFEYCMFTYKRSLAMYACMLLCYVLISELWGSIRCIFLSTQPTDYELGYEESEKWNSKAIQV